MKTLEETILERKSVRSFDVNHPLSADDVATLKADLANAKSPFGGEVVIELKEFALNGPFKPSTYGTIAGARWFFLMGTDSSEEAQLSLGFRMEQVVLKATAMGLGTCWIAATFKGTSFAEAAQFPKSTPLQVIMPVGYPAEKRRLLDKITRATLGSAKRKPLTDLFVGAEGTIFQTPIEMMRLAPSSTNSQPWRALVEGQTVYFYYEKKSEASILDLGIGLSHFYLSAKGNGLNGSFSICKNAPSHDKWIPLVKYVIESN